MNSTNNTDSKYCSGERLERFGSANCNGNNRMNIYIYMMYITNNYEQMVVQELLEQVAEETDVEHLRSSIVTLGNYTPSSYNGTCIVWSGGVTPTVRENHGMVTATIVKVK